MFKFEYKCSVITYGREVKTLLSISRILNGISIASLKKNKLKKAQGSMSG